MMQTMKTTDLHELSRMSATLQHEAAAESDRAAAGHNRAAALPCQANDQIQAIMESEPGYVAWINIDLAHFGANRNLDSGFALTPQAFIGQPVGCIHESAQFIE